MPATSARYRRRRLRCQFRSGQRIIQQRVEAQHRPKSTLPEPVTRAPESVEGIPGNRMFGGVVGSDALANLVRLDG